MKAFGMEAPSYEVSNVAEKQCADGKPIVIDAHSIDAIPTTLPGTPFSARSKVMGSYTTDSRLWVKRIPHLKIAVTNSGGNLLKSQSCDCSSWMIPLRS